MSDVEAPLSEREIEILRLVATGAANKEIAVSLNISPNTVKVHLRNIFSKIGVVSRTEATLFAIKHNFVEPPHSTPSGNQPADEIIFSASPLAIATTPESYPELTEKRPFPIWAVVLSFTAIFLIALLTTALIITRRTPTPTSAPQNPVPSNLARWSFKDPLPSARSAASAVTFGGSLFLIGGRQNEQTFADTLRFDPSKPGWSGLKEKPTPVSEAQAVVIQEKIYIPGGRLADGKPTNGLDVYSFQTDDWETLSPMPKALWGSAVATVEGALFVFGGWDGGEHSRTVYMYNSVSDQWSEVKSLPTARSYMASTVVEGHILLIGGETADGPINNVLVYYPSRDKPGGKPFEEGVALPQPRSKAGAVSLANITYIFGGTNQNEEKLTDIALVEGQSAWTTIDTATQPTGEFPAVLAVGNFIHVIGGKIGLTDKDSHQVYQAIYTITLPLTTN